MRIFTSTLESCRASDFIVALLHRLHDDSQVSLSTAANDAYYKTLYNHHTWYTSAAFIVVLKVVLSISCLCMPQESVTSLFRPVSLQDFRVMCASHEQMSWLSAC